MDIEQIRKAHREAAEAAIKDPEALPVFERMELELAKAEAELESDPIARARAALKTYKATA